MRPGTDEIIVDVLEGYATFSSADGCYSTKFLYKGSYRFLADPSTCKYSSKRIFQLKQGLTTISVTMNVSAELNS